MKTTDPYSQLIKLTLAGSREAYGELYEATIHDVYKTVRFLVTGLSDAEDVVQEIYIELHRSLRRFDRTQAFRPWLMGLTMRQVHAYRRRNWRHLRIMNKAEQTSETMVQDFSSDVVERMTNRVLTEGVSRLPYKLKQVIILHYLHEYSQEEISVILQIPLGTVKSRLHAALQKLRRKHQADTIKLGKVEELYESRT
ncbi:sigma-70 family RNA polymerase sigma factor [Paenibacillus sp. FSL P4-0338]|uniref:sigma-70 family RNA polymerase sigma factor n=1 Tax=unclassified Paenibacillus TaxID=185978 RepID=UPI0003E1BBD4|nr:sigma-70 family RNA polymerase sigma factor [Paenibacillus sp. FSL R7-269]ETT45621.1 RNA polymerase sigma factor [Paenibacillus sp. FSL R7-269]